MTDSIYTTNPSALSLADLNTEINCEPRIKDTRLGERLGMAQPLNIRRTIETNRAELERYGLVHAASEPSRSGRGRITDVTVYWLNEPQTLLICMFSRTPAAAAVRQEVIAVFMAYRRGVVPVRAHTRRRPQTAAPTPSGVTPAQAMALRVRLDALAREFNPNGDLGLQVRALDRLLRGLHPDTGEPDSRLARLMDDPVPAGEIPSREELAAVVEASLSSKAPPPKKPSPPEAVRRPAVLAARQEDAAGAWDDPAAVAALFASFRLRRDEMYQPALITPAQAERMVRDGLIGPRQWARLRKHVTR